MEVLKFRSPQKSVSVSEAVLGIDWEKYFPYQLDNEIQIETSNYEEVARFVVAHPENGERDDRFIVESGEARDRYYRLFGDFFKFTHNGEVVGIFIGTLSDWSTYYFRYCSVRPDFKGKKIYQRMILRISEVLVAHDVARIEGEVSPTNSENIYILNKLGFVIRGNVASERWGNVIQFVKYLNPKNEKVFTDQFCFKKP